MSNLIRDETRECRQVFKPAAGEGLCPSPESEGFFESGGARGGAHYLTEKRVLMRRKIRYY
jgi:hypothetical protein